MRLLLIRHSNAGDRETFAKTGKNDTKRPLTPSGKRKMKAVAGGLRTLYPRIDLLASSPLKRALQTADIVAKAYRDKPEFVEIKELAPGKKPQELLDWLKLHELATTTDPHYTIALVGHEPHLSRFTSWLLTHKTMPILTFKKGGVCMIDFPDGIGPRRGQLEAFISPALLRKA